MEISTRNYKLDALKMCLIISVIFGHIPLLDGFLDLYLPVKYDFLTYHVVKGIYAFHMPLFVMLSGYFTKQNPVRIQFKKSLKLLKLFIVFQFIDLLLRHIFIGETLSVRRCLYPCFALWYLLSLFYWRMLLSVIPQTWNPKLIVIASFLISISVGFTKIDGIMGLHRFFSFMPYFMIGHYYGKNILQFIEIRQSPHTTCTQRPIYVRKTFVFSAFFIIIGLASLNPHWLDCIIQPYGSLKVFVIRVFYLCYSLLLCYFSVCIFSFKHDWSENVLSKFGRNTLLFYLLHPYILYSLTILIGSIVNTINIFSSILITVFTVAILMLVERIKIIHLLIK